jgi:hypothetical protein
VGVASKEIVGVDNWMLGYFTDANVTKENSPRIKIMDNTNQVTAFRVFLRTISCSKLKTASFH